MSTHSFLICVYVCVALGLGVTGCEHAIGRVLRQSELIFVPGLASRWNAIPQSDSPSVVVLTERTGSNDYLLTVEKDQERAIVRFASIQGLIVGEYHDLEKNGRDSDASYFFAIRKSGECFAIYVGTDLTEELIKRNKISGRKTSAYPGGSDSYVLDGTSEQKRRALEVLVQDRAFFDFEKSAPMRLCPI